MRLSRRTSIALALGVPAGALLGPGHVLAAEVVERVEGDPAAPVTIIEYASLTCPHCAAFARDTLPALKERYIDSGKAKLVFRDFPLDQVALRAAIVAHCAGDRYFTFLNALFLNQERWARAADPTAALVQFAVAGGLPRERVEACLADRAMEDAVLRMRLAGANEHQVESTPTFIINGRKLAGARGIEDFAAVIDPLLPS